MTDHCVVKRLEGELLGLRASGDKGVEELGDRGPDRHVGTTRICPSAIKRKLGDIAL